MNQTESKAGNGNHHVSGQLFSPIPQSLDLIVPLKLSPGALL